MNNNTTKPTILLIEDDKDQIFLYQSKFEIEGFEIISSRTGDQGIAMAKSEKPDIILLDLILIAESGIDVLEKLKSEETTKDIPVIILTNLVQKDTKKKAEELGAVDFLIKTDIMPSEVVEIVRGVLKKK